MDFRSLHPWDLNYREAVGWQQRLRRLLQTEGPLDFSRLRLIAGADVAYEVRRTFRAATGDRTARFVAGVVVMRWPSLEIVEELAVAAETGFPYIPGLLSFREGPALELAFEGLRLRPDVVIFDGQGVAHPRGLGLAAHVGILLDCPTVGCAKSRLYGETCGILGMHRGSRRALVAPPQPRRHKTGLPMAPVFRCGERIGTVLRTRDGVKPVFVSCGHRIDLRSAERLVLLTARRWRLPEPIRAAHRVVNSALRQDAL